MAQTEHRTDDDGAAAPARLGAFDIACVVIGGIIGVGIFFTPQVVAERVDDEVQVIAAWAIGGVIAVLGALVFAELSKKVPGHGGTFLYIHAAFGALPAFLYGWANWLVIQAGALGVIGLIMVDNLDVLVFGSSGAATAEGTKAFTAAVAILAFTGINVFGLRTGRGVQNTLTITKTLAVFALVVLALLAGGEERGVETVVSAGAAAGADAPARGFWLAIGAAMLPVLFSFGGWQQGSFVSGAARVPTRDVPLGILAGVAVVVVAYLTVNLSFLDLLGFEGVARSEAIGADAARVALDGYGYGDIASRVLAGMIVVSALGIMNTCCLAPPFVLHAMARKGLFFPRVGAIHPQSGTPVVGVLCQGLWAIVLLFVVHGLFGRQSLSFLADGVVFVDWLFFALCGIALVRLRRRDLATSAWRAPFGGTVAVLFTVAAFGVMGGAVVAMPRPAIAGLCVVLLGFPAFWLLRRAAAR